MSTDTINILSESVCSCHLNRDLNIFYQTWTEVEPAFLPPTTERILIVMTGEVGRGGDGKMQKEMERENERRERGEKELTQRHWSILMSNNTMAAWDSELCNADLQLNGMNRHVRRSSSSCNSIFLWQFYYQEIAVKNYSSNKSTIGAVLISNYSILIIW